MKQVYLNQARLNSGSRSAWSFLIKIAFSVFCAEALVMLLFLVLPKLPELVEVFLDSTLLSVLIAPALYFFVYRPLVREIAVRSVIETELRQSQVLLKQQAQALEETLQKLQQAPQLIQTEKMLSLGRLVAGIAHEINNPVNFVYANLIYINENSRELLELLQLYQQQYPNPDPTIQAKVETIDLDFLKDDLQKTFNSMREGCKRIHQIVLSLRNFSRLDEAEYKAVDIHEGLESTLIILQHRLKSKLNYPPIAVIKNYANLPKVACFPGQLNQAFMNILSNAIDALEEWIETGDANRKDGFSSASESSLTPTITLQTSMMDSQWVKISIADTGLGIPEDIREKIFDPFFTTKPVGRGTGMGLAISYQIIKKHGGQLVCFSTGGAGAEFVIQIPVNQSAKTEFGY